MLPRADMGLLAMLALVLALALGGSAGCARLRGEPGGAASEVDSASPVAILEAPRSLRETGLYADIASKRIARNVVAFAPQYPLWTDGATKRRWIALPEGTFVDASDPEAWRFPVGTKVWKEFSFGRRAETRYMELGPSGWVYATYRWDERETDAVRADDRGETSALEVRPGIRHALPSVAECGFCHANVEPPVIGFSLLQLSPDRDPNALHAEPLRPEELDLRALVARGLVRNLPPRFLAHPPTITARSAIERSAVGYLHGNCGYCHHESGAVASLGMVLAHREGSLIERAIETTVGVPSGFSTGRDPHARSVRVAAGSPETSVLVARIGSRDPAMQMPPLGTQVVDEEAALLVGRWIRALDTNQHP